MHQKKTMYGFAGLPFKFPDSSFQLFGATHAVPDSFQVVVGGQSWFLES